MNPDAAAAWILTVDDDPIVRADLRLVLEDAGFNVCGDARDGVEAVELARSERPDLILLDLSLPRLDGVEAARRILGERPVPIVALTGAGPERDGLAERAVEAGVVSIVRKPFSEESVVDAVAQALESAQEASRTRSQEALGDLVELLGYDRLWAADLERRAFAAGKVWRRTR